MSNFFDQFDTATDTAPPPPPQPVSASAPAPAPSSAAPAVAPAASANFFDQFDQQQPAAGRDALGGYLVPPQAPDLQQAQQAQQPTSLLGRIGHAVDSGVRSVEQGATFGFGDEANAAEQAAEQPLFGTRLGGVSSAPTFTQRYDENLAAERARMADIPTAVAIPGQIVGGAATIAADAPVAVARVLGAGVRLVPGGELALNALSQAGSSIGSTAANALSSVGRYALPAAKAVVEGAGYGGLQGFGDGEGGVQNRLASATAGAETGAVLGPVAAGAGAVVGKVVRAAGYGTRNALLGADGAPLSGTTGQPVTATPTVARAAGQQIADAASDLPAVQAALAQPAPALVPGDRATTFGATGDYGLGQKELELRNTPGTSQAFLSRAADQNAARVTAISNSVAPDASSADLVNSLQAQRAALQASQDAAAARAQQGTLQGVGGTAADTPTQAGAQLRGAIDQARAPAIQVADAAVQRGQQQVAGALDNLGGVPSGDAATAQQGYGQAFRAPLAAGDTAAKANVGRLAKAIDPDGNLAVNMTPIRDQAKDILGGVGPNARPPSDDEAAILQTAANLPPVQSFRDLADLRTQITNTIMELRPNPKMGQSVGRLQTLLGSVHDAMADTASRPDVPVPAASPASVPTSAPNVGSDVFTPAGQRVGVRYEVANAPDLVTSHNADMSVNPAFPAELQPRARDRAASEVQVANIASRLQPERLGASSTVADGAPIVGPDGVVESGNGRVMALRRAYQADGPQAAGYRDWLASQGHDATGIDQPMLIRRRTTPMSPDERVTFADGGNAPTTLAMSATERAAGDARRLPDEVLHQFQPGDVTDPANRDAVRGFLRHAAEPGQEGSFVTGDGQLSQDGASRVRAALVHRAYGSDGLSAALAESTDPTAKVLAGAMQDAAGPMAQLRARIQAGEVDPGVSLAPHVTEAAQTVAQARVKGISLADAVGQRDMLGGGVSPQAERLLRAAYGPDLSGRMSRGQFADLLSDYARKASEQSTTANLFGSNLTRDELLSSVEARYGKTAANTGGGAGGRSTAGSLGAGDGAYGDQARGSVAGAGREATPGGGSGQGRAAQADPRVLEQPSSALTANFDQAAADRYQAMRGAHAERKDTYGPRAPGVGPVLASGPISGSYRMADSAVPSAIFSRGAGAAERVQAAVRAGLTPGQIGDYAAFDLRRAALRDNGTLDPAAFAKWRASNSEALQALGRADPFISRGFDTAQGAASRLTELQAARAALDATHPLAPGWGDAETVARVWKSGPAGADSVRAATQAANGSPVAASSIADYAAHSLRQAAAPDGVLDPARYAQWAKNFDGALSARPDLRAKFATAADAQRTLNTAADQHAVALRDYQATVAKHFLGGANPADAIGRLLTSKTRVRDMADLATLTKNDPAAQAGIQRAIVDHLVGDGQTHGAMVSNSLAGNTGINRLKSDQLQTFVNRAAPALHEVMTPQQVDSLRRVALSLQRDNMSVDGTRVAGGSDSTQKLALLAQGGPGQTLMRVLRDHGLTGLLTIAGAKMGGVGAFVGNAAGKSVAAFKAKGIADASDLVKEAMLNPELARALLTNLTPQNEAAVSRQAVTVLSRLAATRGGHTAAWVANAARPQQPPSSVYQGQQNALSSMVR